VWVPVTFGGMYRPPVVIVPKVAEPPVTPSTDQVTLPLLAVNCCVRVKVSAATRGLTDKPVLVPDTVIVCGLPEALSEIDTVELRVPVVVGVKVTLIVHAAFGVRVAPQLWVWAKSAALPPETAIEPIVREPELTFVKVTGCGPFVIPVCTVPKLMFVLLRLTEGVAPPPETGVRKATICMIHCPELSGAVAL
jgi:hypothetical protein